MSFYVHSTFKVKSDGHEGHRGADPHGPPMGIFPALVLNGAYEAVAGLGRSSPDPSRVGGALDAERPDAGLRLLVAEA